MKSVKQNNGLRELSLDEVKSVEGGYLYFVAIVLALSSCVPELEMKKE